MKKHTADDFESRLINWGEYFKGRYRPGISPTYSICESMAKNAGQGYRESIAKQVIDEEDAQTIEWCWSRCDYRLSKNQRAILKAYYVVGSDPRLICRTLLIRFRSFDLELRVAVMKFKEAVAIFESVGHNAAIDCLTTVQGRELPYEEVGARQK